MPSVINLNGTKFMKDDDGTITINGRAVVETSTGYVVTGNSSKKLINTFMLGFTVGTIASVASAALALYIALL